MSAARSIVEAALDVAQEPHGLVYVLRSAVRGLAKVGYTENLRARLGAQRRWSNGLVRRAPELRAVLVCEFETRDQAYVFEARLLAIFEHKYGTAGLPVDWFPLTATDEENILGLASERHGFVSAWGSLQ